MTIVLDGLTTIIAAIVLTLILGLITGDIKLPKPRRKRSNLKKARDFIDNEIERLKEVANG